MNKDVSQYCPSCEALGKRIAELESQLAAKGEPDGYVLVPVEPTVDYICKTRIGEAIGELLGRKCRGSYSHESSDYLKIWKAMLQFEENGK
jgi:hypothetical protein